MKIILINPPHPYLVNPNAQTPLGILYIASVLLQHNHEVEILNLADKDPDTCAVPECADLYGFSTSSTDYKICKQIATRMRESFRRPPKIIIGGPGITCLPELADYEIFDSYVLGEGEEVILEIVREIKDLHPRYYGQRVKDLDALPLPARHLYDICGDAFKDHCISTNIMGSRGCPYKCAFCASSCFLSDRRKIYYRDVRKVIEEIRLVKSEFGITHFRFNDDTINTPVSRLREFCLLIEKENITWRSCMRVGINTQDDFRMMVDSGCTEAGPGIESFDQRVLDRLNKKMKIADSIAFLEMAAKAGLKPRTLMMSGAPGEREDTPEINRWHINNVPCGYISMTEFRPLPGSPIWYHPWKFGVRILDRDYEKYNLCMKLRENGEVIDAPVVSYIETDELSREQFEDNMRRMRGYVGTCELR